MDADPGKLIFVRQNGTFRFLNLQGDWVARFDEAARFRSTWEACDFCLKKSVHKAEIVLRVGDPAFDTTIDVL